MKLGVLCGELKIKNHEKRNLAENRPHRHHDPDGHRYNLRRIVMHGTLNKKAQKKTAIPSLGLSFRHKKKKGIYHRHPIFINLKSNTMKNTVQR